MNEGLVSIEDYAFYYCDMLDPNTLLNSVTHIGNRAFNYTAAYDNEANWENDLFYIGNCLLESRQHTGAEPIAVKNGTRLIADYAFLYYFPNVTEIVIPDTVTHIGEDAMLSCGSLERISVSEKNTSFESVDGILYNNDMSMLIQYPRGKTENTFEIPETVTVIGKYALSSCYMIESITIPASVVSIDDYAFDYCTSLQKIIYCGTPAQWATISVGTGNGSLEEAELTFQTTSPYTQSEVIRTADGCKVNVSVYNITSETPPDKNIMAAGYNADGILLDTEASEYGNLTEPLVLSGDICKVKIFVWDENMIPYVRDCEIINETEFKTE